MTPGDLARHAGVSENAIRQMELGYTKSASFAVGVKIAEALGVTARHLAIGEEVKPPGFSARAAPADQSRLPEDLGHLIQAIRAEAQAAMAAAQKAQATADEVKSRLERRRRRTA